MLGPRHRGRHVLAGTHSPCCRISRRATTTLVVILLAAAVLTMLNLYSRSVGNASYWQSIALAGARSASSHIAAGPRQGAAPSSSRSNLVILALRPLTSLENHRSTQNTRVALHPDPLQRKQQPQSLLVQPVASGLVPPQGEPKQDAITILPPGKGQHGSDVQASDHTLEPADFNWRAYLLRHTDLRASNIRTRDAALSHYIVAGRKEQRSCQRIPVLLRYTACQGLFNQMYSHVNALVLADYLGADVVLPPSMYRESFAKYFHTELDKNEVRWTPTSVGAILDVEALQMHYRKKGTKIHSTPHVQSYPDCSKPQEAFPQYIMEGVLQDQVVQLQNTYLQSMHVWDLWDRAAENVMAKHHELIAAGWPNNTTIVLDLASPFLSIMTLSCLDNAREAVAALHFNRTLVDVAAVVIGKMRQAGIMKYNGAHVRLEKDAVDWAEILGGVENYLAAYSSSFASAGFSPENHLYVASGLLSYGATGRMKDMLDFLKPYSKSVQYKELYLPAHILAGLNTEQIALIDFLVLLNCCKFVGIGSSTFSTYLRDYRVLLGHSRSTNVFVNTSAIGTDALFENSTHFAPLTPAKPVQFIEPPWQNL